MGISVVIKKTSNSDKKPIPNDAPNEARKGKQKPQLMDAKTVLNTPVFSKTFDNFMFILPRLHHHLANSKWCMR